MLRVCCCCWVLGRRTRLPCAPRREAGARRPDTTAAIACNALPRPRSPPSSCARPAARHHINSAQPFQLARRPSSRQPRLPPPRRAPRQLPPSGTTQCGAPSPPRPAGRRSPRPRPPARRRAPASGRWRNSGALLRARRRVNAIAPRHSSVRLARQVAQPLTRPRRRCRRQQLAAAEEPLSSRRTALLLGAALLGAVGSPAARGERPGARGDLIPPAAVRRTAGPLLLPRACLAQATRAAAAAGMPADAPLLLPPTPHPPRSRDPVRGPGLGAGGHRVPRGAAQVSGRAGRPPGRRARSARCSAPAAR